MEDDASIQSHECMDVDDDYSLSFSHLLMRRSRWCHMDSLTAWAMVQGPEAPTHHHIWETGSYLVLCLSYLYHLSILNLVFLLLFHIIILSFLSFFFFFSFTLCFSLWHNTNPLGNTYVGTPTVCMGKWGMLAIHKQGRAQRSCSLVETLL